MKQTVLLKISGEALLGEKDYGIDNNVVDRIAMEMKEAGNNTQIAVVVGGGNIFRGMQLSSKTGMVRATADSMGMLATIMNAIALKDRFMAAGTPTQILSAFNIEGMIEGFERDKAIRILERGNVLIIAGGTSNPYFTTDSTSILRALEIGASIVLKGTNVDGVYNKDPKTNEDAVMYNDITFKEAINQNLRVMDMTAFAMANDNNMPIRVFNMNKMGNITKAIKGENIGTYVHN
ncbi:UMP kinase [Brachyspira pilosicoli]|uniref:Uridylate kinase n=5 Tax=Brachyspira pilosicoli TaxID=52584 RepID=D8IBQ4_BRAP9|nr:UMP kinase [Brachyspira pilosicoli]ADK30577.1 aspartate/glutamate/uridylate kinase [Brachyspira pilosicoli 95/1000]AFR70138.1 aspartate/glutamate/uridylate kinase [Brachyspira pilosicoli B2904]AGA65389.1 aspartate/glutamate/uridylate kinase [Brachyspira pilosicoli P43/6/78]MBW5377570.1 UMP kinase [Brachyspira pilosicoli]MBW5383361.1 UMP kinase [Brachyspira pilosicoli]